MGTMLKSDKIRVLYNILLCIIALFAVAALLLGEAMDVYEAIWWWDDMLHGLSGVILAFVGLLVVYFFNARRTMVLSSIFVTVFAFCFAMTMGVFWEVYEFTMDIFFHTTMQQWNMGEPARTLGVSFQGMGLRDTMSDLIIATVGAIIGSIGVYFQYKREPLTMLGRLIRMPSKLLARFK